jgi:hypothetical protein
MKRWHYIAILLAAVPVAGWAFWGPGGMSSSGAVGDGGAAGPTSVVLTAKVAEEYDGGIYINSKLISYNGGAGTVFATQAVNSAVEYTFLCQELPQLQLDSVSGETSCSVTSDNWTEFGGNIEVTVTNVTPASFTADLSEGGGGA